MRTLIIAAVLAVAGCTQAGTAPSRSPAPSPVPATFSTAAQLLAALSARGVTCAGARPVADPAAPALERIECRSAHRDDTDLIPDVAVFASATDISTEIASMRKALFPGEHLYVVSKPGSNWAVEATDDAWTASAQKALGGARTLIKADSL